MRSSTRKIHEKRACDPPRVSRLRPRSGQVFPPLGRKRSVGASGRRSLLLSFQLFKVELKFFALEDVTINTAGLAWAGRDGCEQTTGVELISDFLVNLAVLLQTLELALDGAATLGLATSFIRFFNLLLVELNVVLLEVPLSEGSGIDHDNGALDEGLGTDELVVCSVVGAVEHTSLGGHSFGAPGEVAGVSSEGAALDVATAATNVDALLGAKLGHGRHSTHFELSLFLVDWHAATRGPPLVPRVPRNTHTS